VSGRCLLDHQLSGKCRRRGTLTAAVGSQTRVSTFEAQVVGRLKIDF
jgi:hypothetical protein